MLSAADVRRELVAVLAAVAADVALEGLAEAVAAHVDGEHDMVQEEDATVPTVEGAHGPAVPVQHLHNFHGGQGSDRAPLCCRGRRTRSLPLWVQVFGLPGAGSGTAARQRWGWVVEVVVVGGNRRGCGPCALLLCCALCVCRVGAAVGRGDVPSGRAPVITAAPSLLPCRAKGHCCRPTATTGLGARRSQVAVDRGHGRA